MTKNEPITSPERPTSTPESNTGDSQGRKPSIADVRQKLEDVRTEKRRYNKTGRYSKREVVDVPESTFFNAENTRPYVRLPFNIAVGFTGYEGFKLSETEEVALAEPGAVILNHYVKVAPHILAVITFSTSLIAISAAKFLGFSEYKKQHKAENAT